MKKLLVLMFLCTVGAFAQACEGGFWGNGQCIGACESPLVNPNVSLSFYGWLCQSQPPCEDNYLYCYPSYTAWDNAYNQYCGVINDWNDGGCAPMPPYLRQEAPKRHVPEDEPMPFFSHSAFKVALTMRRPVKFTPTPIRNVQLKNRFWWKHYAAN